MPHSRLFRISPVVLGLALVAPAQALLAGSTKPNYPALKLAVDGMRNDLRGVDSQWTWLSGKHDAKEWGAKYDAFVQKHDVPGLNQFLKTSGFEFNPFSMADRLCSGKVCLALPASGEWIQRKSQHPPLRARLDAFLLKISQDKGFGEKLEQLVMHNNRQGLIDFCRGEGLGDISIINISSDFRFHFHCGFFDIDFGW